MKGTSSRVRTLTLKQTGGGKGETQQRSYDEQLELALQDNNYVRKKIPEVDI
jgi:hypothetical protein